MSKALEIVKNLSEEVDEEAILQELVDELGKNGEFEEEIRGSFDSKGGAGLSSFGEAGSFTADGTEYTWISSEEEAERIALEIVKNDLESEPEIFNQDWLQGFLSITDADKRMIASEEADSRVGDMSDEDVIEQAGMEDEYEEASDDDKDQVIENAKEAVREKISDEMESKLDDPIGYFVDEQGIYTVQDLMKQPWVSIDIESAADDALRSDGWEHFLSRYDGNYETTSDGVVYFREN